MGNVRTSQAHDSPCVGEGGGRTWIGGGAGWGVCEQQPTAQQGGFGKGGVEGEWGGHRHSRAAEAIETIATCHRFKPHLRRNKTQIDQTCSGKTHQKPTMPQA